MPSLISAGPLDWPTVPGPCGPTGPDGIDPAVWAAAEAAAAGWLWALSGRRYGTWDVVYRPEWTDPAAARRISNPGYGAWPRIALPWLAPPPPLKVRLPGPVQSITAVLVDNATVASSAYQLVRDMLIRTDGTPWPVSQDTTQPTTAVGTWQITYVRGADVPLAGQHAAGTLACEIAASMLNDDSCRLPTNVQTVTRNGVTINVNALQQLNLTGIDEIDTWVQSVNPARLTRNPTVWSPDIDPDLLPSPAATH